MVDNQVITSVMSRGSRSRENLHFLLDITLPGARNSFEKHFFEVSAGPCRHISTFKWAEQSKVGFTIGRSLTKKESIQVD
jgi:hypothetical protein